MGFTFRKRNPNGFNVSFSSRGLRISKTAKMGNATANVGRYFGGTHGGKTTGNWRIGSGGVQYRKDFTLGKTPNPSVSSPRKSVSTVGGTTGKMSDTEIKPLWFRWMMLHLNAYASLLYIPVLWIALLGQDSIKDYQTLWNVVSTLLYTITIAAPGIYLFKSGLIRENHEFLPLARTLWVSQIFLFIVLGGIALYAILALIL